MERFDSAYSDTSFQHWSSDGSFGRLVSMGMVSSGVVRSGRIPYQVLSNEELWESQEMEIRRVSEVLEISGAATRVLLKHFNWDCDKMITAWYEDSPKTRTEAGLPADIGDARNWEGTITGQCQICFDDSDQVTALSCGHQFCQDCWKGYLLVKLGDHVTKIDCPGFKCSMAVDSSVILNILDGDVGSRGLYRQLLVDSFVQENPYAKPCPAADCTYTVLNIDHQPNTNMPAECKCGHTFCFGCLEPSHHPASCTMMEKWQSNDDSMNKSLINVISRPCPKCNRRIQKNGGCNHMQCLPPGGCGYHFCWTCMGYFKDYGHTCNSYYHDTKEVKQSKAEIKRYNFYSTRFLNHRRSGNTEKTMLDNKTKLADQMGKHLGDFSKGDLLAGAMLTLLQSRTVLTYSYVFGYYREKDCPEVPKDMFEFLQVELEQATEQLSECLETIAKDVTLCNLQELVNFHQYCEQKLKALLSAAESHWMVVLPEGLKSRSSQGGNDELSERAHASSSSVAPSTFTTPTSTTVIPDQARTLEAEAQVTPTPAAPVSRSEAGARKVGECGGQGSDSEGSVDLLVEGKGFTPHI